MKKLRLGIFATALALLTFSTACFGDTFTHRQRGEVVHGYAVGQAEGVEVVVHTEEKGVVRLNLAEWEAAADRLGRNNKVIILTIDNEMMFEIETEALERALGAAVEQGPLFILLEIDTPGGRTDLVRRICGAIADTGGCEVVAFVNGGPYGGAISAGAAAALSRRGGDVGRHPVRCNWIDVLRAGPGDGPVPHWRGDGVCLCPQG